MKVIISRTPHTTSTGNVAGVQDRISIVVEGEPQDTIEAVARGFKKVDKILKEDTK